jgi:hypothetical protein
MNKSQIVDESVSSITFSEGTIENYSVGTTRPSSNFMEARFSILGLLGRESGTISINRAISISALWLASIKPA